MCMVRARERLNIGHTHVCGEAIFRRAPLGQCVLKSKPISVLTLPLESTTRLWNKRNCYLVPQRIRWAATGYALG
jgi:hypothetical protein